MGVLDTLKEAVGLMQKVDNIELYKRMLELQSQVVTLVEENRALNERLVTREKLSFSKNAYWLDDAGPFCSSCWDKEGKLVRLHGASKDSAGSPQCPVCRHYAVDPDVQRPIHQRLREGRTGAGPDEPSSRRLPRSRGGY